MTSRILTVLFLLCLSIPALADGETTGAALLIIDVQYFYFPDGALPLVEPESASANIARLLEKWRGDGGLVVHVGHKVGQGGDFHCDANPLDGETIFMKEEVNAFRGTGLLAYLQEKEIERLVIVGMQTHMCLEGAVRAAHDFGFECRVVADACATRDLTFGDNTVPAAAVHNGTLSTLSGTYAEVLTTDALLAGQ